MKKTILLLAVVLGSVLITSAQQNVPIFCPECPIINDNTSQGEANCTSFFPRQVPIEYHKMVFYPAVPGSQYTFDSYGINELKNIKPEQPIIIFFHGINSDGRGCWKRMIANLSRQVFPSMVTINNSRNAFMPVYVTVNLDGEGYRCPNAERILYVYEEIVKRIPGCNSIYIVTHSKGSLDNMLALYLSNKRNSPVDQQFKSRLRKVWNIAPPHGGSDIPNEIIDKYTGKLKKGINYQASSNIATKITGWKQYWDLTSASCNKYIEMYERNIRSTSPGSPQRFNPPVSTIGAWGGTVPMNYDGDAIASMAGLTESVVNKIMSDGANHLANEYGHNCANGGNDGAVPYRSTRALRFTTEPMWQGGCKNINPDDPNHPNKVTKTNHGGIQQSFDVAFYIGKYIYDQERYNKANKICPLVSYNGEQPSEIVDREYLAGQSYSSVFSDFEETTTSSATNASGPSEGEALAKVAFDPAVFESREGLLTLNPNYAAGRYTYENGSPIRMSLYATDVNGGAINQANVSGFVYKYSDPSNEIPVTFHAVSGGLYEMDPITLPEGSFSILIDAESESENFYKSISRSFAVSTTENFDFALANYNQVVFNCEQCTPDAGISLITGELTQEGDNYYFNPEIKFKNHGDISLYSCKFSYSIDDENTRHPLNKKWEGQLEANKETSEPISLSQIINIPITAKSITIYTESPNEIEGDDRNKENDGKKYDLNCLLSAVVKKLDFKYTSDNEDGDYNFDIIASVRNNGSFPITKLEFEFVVEDNEGQKTTKNVIVTSDETQNIYIDPNTSENIIIGNFPIPYGYKFKLELKIVKVNDEAVLCDNPAFNSEFEVIIDAEIESFDELSDFHYNANSCGKGNTWASGYPVIIYKNAGNVPINFATFFYKTRGGGIQSVKWVFDKKVEPGKKAKVKYLEKIQINDAKSTKVYFQVEKPNDVIDLNKTNDSLYVELEVATVECQMPSQMPGLYCRNCFTRTEIADNGDDIEYTTCWYSLCESGGEKRIGQNTNGTTDMKDANGIIDLTLFPNPTSGMLSVSYNSETQTEITIQNMLGQIVVREAGSMGSNQHLLDLGQFENGMYILQIYDGKQTITKKVSLVKGY